MIRFSILLALLALFGCSPTGDPIVTEGQDRGSLPPPESELRSLILVTVDTWRGDHFLTKRADQALTPNLATLARSGVHFSDNSSVAAMTSPGVAGIMTGLMPVRSGVLRNVHQMPEAVPYLPATLSRQGFRTAAFVANPVLRKGLGFERGFESYELLPARAPNRKARAEAVVSSAKAWLTTVDLSSERVFLWLHLLEPHGPYEPPAELLGSLPMESFGGAEERLELQPAGVDSGWGGVPHYQWSSDLFPDETDARSYLARYAAEVQSMDRALGDLFRWLDQALNEEERSALLIVVASDHGEALNDDHGFYFSHANPPSEDQLRTPLLFSYAGAAGTVVQEPVSNLDILPTILNLLGVSGHQSPSGYDLSRPVPADRVVVAQYAKYRSVRSGRYRLTTSLGEPDRAWELTTGSGGAVLPSLPAEVEQRLRGALAEIDEIEQLAPSIDRPVLSEDEKESLRRLGYLVED